MGESTAAEIRCGLHNTFANLADFWSDEDASVIAEYALVLTFFAIVSVIAVTVVGDTANTEVDIDESNFSNSMVVGN